jgi:hypothetical protein
MLFTLGKIITLVSFISAIYFLASAGTSLTLYLAYTGVSVLGMVIGGLLVKFSDRSIIEKPNITN